MSRINNIFSGSDGMPEDKPEETKGVADNSAPSTANIYNWKTKQPQMPPKAPPQPAQLSGRIMELLTMLTYKRPAGSKSEAAFIKRYIEPLGCTQDGYGNYWRQIGDPSCPILWSSHTDTVHKEGGIQKVTIGHWIATTENSNCLGADCTTGVWLMRNMIQAGIPGRYVFHREEECGGHGSSHVAKKEPKLLDGIKFAIAFDRKGGKDVITHQAGQRTASNAFAKSLAAALDPLVYEPDDWGVFTDTANYDQIVPECSNISVGYYNAHSKDELQDVYHAQQLLKVLLKADFTKLVCERDPSQPDLDAWYGGYYGAWRSGPTRKSQSTRTSERETDAGALEDYVYSNYELVASYLEELGVTLEELEQYEFDMRMERRP